MSALGAARVAVQNPLVGYAEAGRIYLPREDALRLRRGEDGPVLYDVLIEQLQRLNPSVVDHARAEDVAHRFDRGLPGPAHGCPRGGIVSPSSQAAPDRAGEVRP